MDFVHPVASLIPGVQGRALAVLAATTAELNMRTLSRLSGVSVAQLSRVLPHLVELGVVERRDVGSSALFLLNRAHVASRAVVALDGLRQTILVESGVLASGLPVPPRSVIVFGSFARGDSSIESDIDVVVVRPAAVAEDDDAWVFSVDQWRDRVQVMTGNCVEILEVDEVAAPIKLSSDAQVWRDIRREGIVIHGASIEQLVGGRSG